MSNHTPLQLKRAVTAFVGVPLLSLSQLVTPAGSSAGTYSAPASDNVCLSESKAQINKVRYVGKNSNGDDEVAVDWQVFSISECVPFGSGQDVPLKSNESVIQPTGYEITVKIKRHLGNEDSGKVTKREIVKGANSTIVRIPRAKLETDPVSFTATLKTTAGAVQTFNRVITGVGVPTLVGVTQNTNKHSTVPNIPDKCFPSVSVTAINFIPGSGATPDNVSINWAGSGPTTDCKEFPRFAVAVQMRRAAGNLDKAQTTFSPDATSGTLQLPGAPGNVTNFSITITAINGNVVEKTSTQGGNF